MSYEYDDMKMAAVPAGLNGEQVAGQEWNDDDEPEPRRVTSSSTLRGNRVRNSAGEDLGKIEEIMIDVPTGKVAYAVLSFGGFLGIGEKLFAVPWQALELDQREHEFMLNADRKLLENAPGFDRDNWPDMADRNFCAQIYGYYGFEPYR